MLRNFQWEGLNQALSAMTIIDFRRKNMVPPVAGVYTPLKSKHTPGATKLPGARNASNKESDYARNLLRNGLFFGPHWITATSEDGGIGSSACVAALETADELTRPYTCRLRQTNSRDALPVDILGGRAIFRYHVSRLRPYYIVSLAGHEPGNYHRTPTPGGPVA